MAAHYFVLKVVLKIHIKGVLNVISSFKTLY